MKNLFAERLSKLLKEEGLSKRGFAAAIGISGASVCDWTNRHIQPSAESIYLVAEYFHVSADYLLGLEDETGTKKY